MNQPEDLITTAAAQRILGISKKKMSSLLKEGAVSHFPNPLDKRQKLVSRAEVLALIPKRAEAA